MDKPSEQNLDQISHSGKLPEEMRELPFIEDDSITLAESKDKYLDNIPSSTADLLGTGIKENGNSDLLTTTTTATPEVGSKKPNRLMVIGISALAAIGITAAAITGLNATNSTAGATPEPNDDKGTSETPSVPTETEVAPTGFEVVGLPSVSELEISAEQSNEDIAKDLISVDSQWITAGANKEMYELQFEGDNGYLTLPEYITKVADASDPIFEKVMYGENATDPAFQASIEKAETQHKQVLEAHYGTYGAQYQAPYVQADKFLSLDSVTENADGTTTFVIESVREDNRDLNIVEGSGNGIITESTYVTAKVDGKVVNVQPPVYTNKS